MLLFLILMNNGYYPWDGTLLPATPSFEAAGQKSLSENFNDMFNNIKIEALLNKMTLEEKIGQMALVEKNSIRPEDIQNKNIGALLSGGGGNPTPNTPDSWLEMVSQFSNAALDSPLGIPLLYAVDAVHGHGNVKGATIFPHNIGLGATKNPELVRKIGEATAEEMKATGVYWNLAPSLDVPKDIRWGRTFEGYSENPELVSELGIAYIKGLQSRGVMATPKHYLGAGGTGWQSSIHPSYKLDQGNNNMGEEELRKIFLAPFKKAVLEGVMSIMVSHNSWQSAPLHSHHYLLTTVLKEELGFEGFLLSDWQAVDNLPGDYQDKLSQAVNAGVDMVMVPHDYDKFIETLADAVRQNKVSEKRIDDAVRRILKAKFNLGLFNSNPPALAASASGVGKDGHRQLARQAVRESIVILKNDSNFLPILKNAKSIFVAGEAADDIGIQSGGWTIEWQGQAGNITPGTTILSAIKNATSKDTVVSYAPDGKVFSNQDNKKIPGLAEVGIAVVGERPYAEGFGDKEELTLSKEDIESINNLKKQSKKLIVVLISGRPLDISKHIGDWEAVLAAWLPGTEGQGVADILFGDYPATGQLPYPWPNLKPF